VSSSSSEILIPTVECSTEENDFFEYTSPMTSTVYLQYTSVFNQYTCVILATLLYCFMLVREHFNSKTELRTSLNLLFLTIVPVLTTTLSMKWIVMGSFDNLLVNSVSMIFVLLPSLYFMVRITFGRKCIHRVSLTVAQKQQNYLFQAIDLVCNILRIISIFAFGCLSFLTNTYTVPSVADYWLFLWTGEQPYLPTKKIREIDYQSLHEVLVAHAFLHCLPQLILLYFKSTSRFLLSKEEKFCCLLFIFALCIAAHSVQQLKIQSTSKTTGERNKFEKLLCLYSQ
jgi:hypothetical protein